MNFRINFERSKKSKHPPEINIIGNGDINLRVIRIIKYCFSIQEYDIFTFIHVQGVCLINFMSLDKVLWALS